MKRSVDLIASGYEWKCPECGFLNKEAEVYSNVTCEKCEQVFDVNEYNHAVH